MPVPASVPATQLITALMDLAGITDVLITDDQLAKVAADQLRMDSHQSDPQLRPGTYRLHVDRRRSPIVVAGSVLDDAALRRGPKEIR